MLTLFIHALKSMLSIVILGSVLIGVYEGMGIIGIPLGASVLDFEKAIEELLKGLPHVGSVMDAVFNVRGAIGNASAAQVSLLMEVVHGMLLFVAFKLMHGIKRLVDQIFYSMLTHSGLLFALVEYVETMFLVFVTVILSSVLKKAAEVLFSLIGIYTGSGMIVVVLAMVIFISICIGKKIGGAEAIINAAFELVWGFVVVGLIYMVVLCTQILSLYSEILEINEFIWVFSGEIIGLLALTMIGANVFAKSIKGIFNINQI